MAEITISGEQFNSQNKQQLYLFTNMFETFLHVFKYINNKGRDCVAKFWHEFVDGLNFKEPEIVKNCQTDSLTNHTKSIVVPMFFKICIEDFIDVKNSTNYYRHVIVPDDAIVKINGIIY